jgi:hypothetical protein
MKKEKEFPSNLATGQISISHNASGLFGRATQQRYAWPGAAHEQRAGPQGAPATRGHRAPGASARARRRSGTAGGGTVVRQRPYGLSGEHP